MKTRTTLLFICRAVVAIVFIAAACPKIMAPHEFAIAVFRYQILPSGMINIVAIYLPWLELLAGLWLLFIPKGRDGAAFILLALLLFFTTAIIVNIFRGIDIACGCFSVKADVGRIGWKKVIENILLILLAFVAFFDSLKQKQVME